MKFLIKMAAAGAIALCLTAAGPVCDTGMPGKSGCCSHHGGVCGCNGAMQRCCDGTNSPSCRCGD